MVFEFETLPASIDTCKGKGKCKVIPLQDRCGPEVGRGIALLFHDAALEGG